MWLYRREIDLDFPCNRNSTTNFLTCIQTTIFYKTRCASIPKQIPKAWVPLMINLLSISEIKITYNPKFKASELPKVSSSGDAFDVIQHQWEDIHYRESFAILLLSRANKCLGFTFISKGGLSGTVADPKMIFQAALKANASSIVLAHYVE